MDVALYLHVNKSSDDDDNDSLRPLIKMFI